MKFFNRLTFSMLLCFSISISLANQMNTATTKIPGSITLMPTTIVPSNEPPDWRDFRTVTAHPDGEHIFFVECRKDFPENCRVMRLNLRTKGFAYFALPAGYSNAEAYVSPSGKKIALVRMPLQYKTFPDTLERREIAIVNSDGTGFEVLPLALGAKTRPTFNATDDRLAFWRATPRIEQGAKSAASGYDVWEYDFKTGKEYPFGTSYRFFGGGEIHYLDSGNDILIKAEPPLEQAARLGKEIRDYQQSFPNQVFILRRGDTRWVTPLFAQEHFSGVQRLALARDGAMVFDATPPKGSTAIYRQMPTGDFLQWSHRSAWDTFDTASLYYAVVVGSELIGIFNNKNQQRAPDAKRFLILNMDKNTWRALSIPPAMTALAVPLALK